MVNLQKLIRNSHILFFVEPFREHGLKLLINLVNIGGPFNELQPTEVSFSECIVIYIRPILFAKRYLCSSQIVSQLLVLVKCTIRIEFHIVYHPLCRVVQKSRSYICPVLLHQLICSLHIKKSLLYNVTLVLAV